MNATPDPATVARNYFASFDTADPATIAAHVTEDFVNVHTAGLGSGCTGRAVYQERLVNFLADMTGLIYEIDHLIAGSSGDPAEPTDVAVFYTMRASWQGQSPFAISGAQRLVVRHGLIAHRTDYWDSAVFLAQVDDNARAALKEMGISTAS